jgi:hypothetical protein
MGAPKIRGAIFLRAGSVRAMMEMALLIPSMASSTSSQKCLSVARSGSPALELDRGVILPSSYFCIAKGTPFIARYVASKGVGVTMV